jgi:hypothetical protein
MLGMDDKTLSPLGERVPLRRVAAAGEVGQLPLRYVLTATNSGTTGGICHSFPGFILKQLYEWSSSGR